MMVMSNLEDEQHDEGTSEMVEIMTKGSINHSGNPEDTTTPSTSCPHTRLQECLWDPDDVQNNVVGLLLSDDEAVGSDTTINGCGLSDDQVRLSRLRFGSNHMNDGDDDDDDDDESMSSCWVCLP